MPTDDEKAAGQPQLLESAGAALERLDSLIATTNAAQVGALRNVPPELERLEKMFAAGRAERMMSLNNFDADADLERLESLAEEQRNEFDALDLIGELRLGRGETSGAGRHSIPACWPGYWTQGKVTGLGTVSSGTFFSVPECGQMAAPQIGRRLR